MPPPGKSSLRDSALAGQDGVEGLVGVDKDAKNIVHLTDEERRPLARSRVPSKPHGQLVSWSSHAARRLGPHVLDMVLTAPLGPYTMPRLAAKGLHTFVVMTRSSVQTSGHEEVWVCGTTDSCGSL